MKRKLALFLILAMTVSLAACGEESDDPGASEGLSQTTEENSTEEYFATDTGITYVIAEHLLHPYVDSHYDYSWDEEKQAATVSLQYPEVGLSESEQGFYPELTSALDELSKQLSESARSAFEELQFQFDGDYAENYQTGMELEYTMNASFRRVDSHITSVLFDTFTYSTEGGSLGIGSACYDSMYGDQLELSDVIKDIDTFTDMVAADMQASYPDVTFDEDADWTEAVADAAWTMDQDGVTVYLEPGEVSDGEFDLLTAHVTIANHEELFDENYLYELPDHYAERIALNIPYYLDLGRDGEEDRIIISSEVDEYDTYTKDVISVNGSEQEFDTYHYGMEAFCLYLDDDTYLYLYKAIDNDYGCLTIYRLTADGAELLGEESYDLYEEELTKISEEEDEEDEADVEYITHRIQLTDPDDYRMSVILQQLSSTLASDYFATGSDGLPVRQNPYWTIEGDWQFTTLSEVTGKLVESGQGEATDQEVTIPAGSRVTYIFSDGKYLADLELEDGTFVRIELDADTWPAAIDGTPIEEIFDGVIFAG